MTSKRWDDAQYRRNCAKVLEYATCCTWCGRPISRLLPVGHPLKATCDHVLSRARGGTNELANLVPSCFQCNNRKRDKSPNVLLPPRQRSREW